MRKLIFILLLFISFHAFAQKKNFSGTWLLNKVKTDLEKAPEWVIPKTIKIDQQADKLILIRTSLDASLNEQAPVQETLSFDGTPFIRNAGSGSVITTAIHWTDDQTFTLNRKGSNTANETWSLLNEGKVLSIVRTVEQEDGLKYTLKCYYDKP